MGGRHGGVCSGRGAGGWGARFMRSEGWWRGVLLRKCELGVGLGMGGRYQLPLPKLPRSRAEGNRKVESIENGRKVLERVRGG